MILAPPSVTVLTSFACMIDNYCYKTLEYYNSNDIVPLNSKVF